VSSDNERSRTAFVFAGGGSFGAIHGGMLHSLASRGITADMVVGSSVGALNGAYYAGIGSASRKFLHDRTVLSYAGCGYVRAVIATSDFYSLATTVSGPAGLVSWQKALGASNMRATVCHPSLVFTAS
jgi:predicted acylesterase/phospholipase RssA